MLRSRRRVLRILTLIQRNWSTLIKAKDMGLCVDICCWLSETFSRRQVFDIEKLLSWIVVKIFGRFRYIFFCLDFSVVWMSECLLRLLLPVFSNNFIVFCKIFRLCFKTRLNVLILYQWQDFRRKTIEFF